VIFPEEGKKEAKEICEEDQPKTRKRRMEKPRQKSLADFV